MMWQIVIAVLLGWFAISIGAAALVGQMLRRSGATLDVCAPQLRGEGPSSLDMVRAG